MVSHTVQDVMTTAVPTAGRPVLDHLLQLYLYDFSDLDSYWQEPGCVPLLIRADGRIAGFVLLNQWSALDRPLDRAVGEFFVLGKYGLAGIGTRAASQLFHRYPGRWKVAVADYNPAALLFWRSVVRSLGAAAQATEHVGNSQRWSGPVLCFASGSAA